MGALNTHGNTRSSEKVKIIHKEIKKDFFIDINEYGGTIKEAKKRMKTVALEICKDYEGATVTKVAIKIKPYRGSHRVRLRMTTNIKQ